MRKLYLWILGAVVAIVGAWIFWRHKNSTLDFTGQDGAAVNGGNILPDVTGDTPAAASTGTDPSPPSSDVAGLPPSGVDTSAPGDQGPVEQPPFVPPPSPARPGSADARLADLHTGVTSIFGSLTTAEETATWSSTLPAPSSSPPVAPLTPAPSPARPIAAAPVVYSAPTMAGLPPGALAPPIAPPSPARLLSLAPTTFTSPLAFIKPPTLFRSF